VLRQIRADFDRETITVYQAYSPAIAAAAMAAGRFVAPFSFGRMTWIKPSLPWLLHRSNWARRPGQERILAVRITRSGWEDALARSVPTDADLSAADVYVQWDPERSLRGAALNYYSIQIGIGRALIRTCAEGWVAGLTDLTPLVHRAADLLRHGQAGKAQRLLPPELVYPLSPALARHLDADR
jgi:hypothetical protein